MSWGSENAVLTQIYLPPPQAGLAFKWFITQMGAASYVASGRGVKHCNKLYVNVYILYAYAPLLTFVLRKHP